MNKIANKMYARFPIIKDGYIYFVSGNELYKYAGIEQFSNETVFAVPQMCLATEDIAYLHPSSDEPKIACVSSQDGGPDVYVYNTQDCSFERLTYFEQNIRVVSFNSKSLLFLSTKDSVFKNNFYLYEYDFATKEVISKHIGPVNWMDWSLSDQLDKKCDVFYQRYGYGYTNWKGYKGGTAGQIWKNGERLIKILGNCLKPLVVDSRVYFLHDNGENGNIFSCDLEGQDFTQHTFHRDFHVQDLSKFDNRLIYTIGGRIGVYETTTQKNWFVDIKYTIPHIESRPFIPDASRFITSISTNGTEVVSAIRGSVFRSGVYSGGMHKLSKDLRYRVAGMLNDKRKFAIKEPPNMALYIWNEDGSLCKKIELESSKIGYIRAANEKNYLAYSNHKHELHVIDYETEEDNIIFSAKSRLHYFDWSHDGNYLVYTAPDDMYQSRIRVYDVQNKQHYDLTHGGFCDFAPSFDPSGQYICFLSNRAVQCESDGLKFDWGFSHRTKVFAIGLKKNINLLAPWLNEINEKSIEKMNEKDFKKDVIAENVDDDNDKNKSSEINEQDSKSDEAKERLTIDFDEIHTRVIELPLKEKNYLATYAIHDSKLLLLSAHNSQLDDDEEEVASDIDVFCFKTLSKDSCYKNVGQFTLSVNKEWCVVEEESKFKILKSGEKLDETGYKKNAIFDLNLYKYPIDQKMEWHQMMHEIWWLIREFFWSETITKLKWDAVWGKYAPYVENIRTRQELDDIMNEVQGEVGTSHAFIFSDSYCSEQKRGFLGADFEFDFAVQKYRITRIFDSSLQDSAVSPFYGANAGVKVGDYLISIDGEKLDLENSIDKNLANKSKVWVTLVIERASGEIKKFDVLTLESEKALRYRNWVEENKKYVHTMTNGSVGYIHIPDMQSKGFKEFFQNYLVEYDKQALVIDVRYNTGGNISSILIEQLNRKRLGLDVTRWHGLNALPNEASRGAYVLLTNAHTASDGELFSHSFKALKLGKVIGERTWGGVVGIHPRYPLVDGTLTSQPEMATWFGEIGFSIENTGVSPDEELMNDYLTKQSQENDLQLNAGIKHAMTISGVNFEESVAEYKHYIRDIKD